MITLQYSRHRPSIAVSLAILLFASPSTAQKKGGAAAASPASSSATAATSSNAPFEVEMLAYGALDQIMGRVANYACSVAPIPAEGGAPAAAAVARFGNVVVLDPPSLQALQAYDAFTVNATALAAAFANMQGKSGAGSGIDDFADITNAIVAAATASTSESSFTFTIQDPTAAIVLLHYLRSRTNTVCKGAFYAGVYSINETNDVKIHNHVVSSVSAELSGLAGARGDALKAVMNAGQSETLATRSGVPCAPIPSGAAAISPGGSKLYTFSAQDPCITAFNNLDGSYNTFLGGLSTPNATTGSAALSSILQGYRLRKLFATATLERPMLGIYLSVSAAGGTQQVRKNLFTAIFTGDWIRYSGGVSINIIMFQIANGETAATDNSKILLSHLIRYRTPLERVKKPKRYDHAADAGDNLLNIPEIKDKH